MHPSSFDQMAAFRRAYLDARRGEPLMIVDLGSHDVNGSYQSLFAEPPWHYQGVDVASGKNVDLVLRNAYDWRELITASADVVICGQTLEHTEFFWETMLEIARVLKPHGLCCIIVPSSGPQHLFPTDCWRTYPDGLRAMARYAGLEVLEARTQWEDLEQYDIESNIWHDSVLVARKPPEHFRKRLRRKLHAWLKRYLPIYDWTPETVIQVYYSTDGILREENTVFARASHDVWENIPIVLPEKAKCSPLRIDFMGPFDVIDIASISLRTPEKTIFRAENNRGLEAITIAGDAHRLANSEFLRVKITGMDPQLLLPPIADVPGGKPLIIELRMRVHSRALPAV
jgi:SAM-dependent methyltransferase